MYVYTMASSPINLSYYVLFLHVIYSTTSSHLNLSSHSTLNDVKLLHKNFRKPFLAAISFRHCIYVNEYLQCFFPLHEYKFTSSFKLLHIFTHITFEIVQFICFISASSLCLLHLSSFFYFVGLTRRHLFS